MFVIYGVSDCPYCLHAQALCMEKLDYQSGDEELVGGFDELQARLLSTEE
jgi:glutaredoxin